MDRKPVALEKLMYSLWNTGRKKLVVPAVKSNGTCIYIESKQNIVLAAEKLIKHIARHADSAEFRNRRLDIDHVVQSKVVHIRTVLAICLTDNEKRLVTLNRLHIDSDLREHIPLVFFLVRKTHSGFAGTSHIMPSLDILHIGLQLRQNLFTIIWMNVVFYKRASVLVKVVTNMKLVERASVRINKLVPLSA